MKTVRVLIFGALVALGCKEQEQASPYVKYLKGYWVMDKALIKGEKDFSPSDYNGYVKANGLDVVGSRPFGTNPAKEFIQIEDGSLMATIFELENDKQYTYTQRLDFEIVGQEFRVKVQGTDNQAKWKMVKLNATTLHIQGPQGQMLYFTKSAVEAIQAQTSAATFNLEITPQLSPYGRNISHVGTTGLISDPEIHCSVNKDKQLEVIYPGLFKLAVDSFDVALKAMSIKDDSHTKKITAIYKEDKTDQSLSVEGRMCKVDSSLDSNLLKLTFDCPESVGSQGQYEGEPSHETLLMKGSVVCRPQRQ